MSAFDYNTPLAVSALGRCVIQCFKELLREIEVAIKKDEREKTERSQSYESTGLHPGRGFQDYQATAVGTGAAVSGQVRQNEEEVSAEIPSGAVEHHDPVGEAASQSVGSGTGSELRLE